MTINDVNDLKNFFSYGGGFITAKKVRALRIVAKQVSDCDLQDVLLKLASDLAINGSDWRGKYLRRKVIDIRPYENVGGDQYSISVIIKCKPGRLYSSVRPNRENWTWTRVVPNSKELLSWKLDRAARLPEPQSYASILRNGPLTTKRPSGRQMQLKFV